MTTRQAPIEVGPDDYTLDLVGVFPRIYDYDDPDGGLLVPSASAPPVIASRRPIFDYDSGSSEASVPIFDYDYLED